MGAAAIRSDKEIKPLTGLRGLAAIYVVFYHYFPLATSADLSNPLKRVLDHGCLAVDLFFVLSGFVMAVNYRHLFAERWSLSAYRTFLGRRIARIYPLYLAATLAGLGLILIGWLSYSPSVPPSLAIVFNVLMLQAWGLTASFDSPAWSVSAEWAAYLLFPALLIPALLRRPAVAWLCALACAAALAGLCTLSSYLVADRVHEYLVRTPLNHNGYWLGLPVLRCIPEFTLGLLAFRLAATRAGHRLAASSWIAPMLCLATFALLATPRADLAIVLLIPLLVISLTSEAHLPGRVLASPPATLAGRLSYSIYLTHKLLLGLLGWLVLRAQAAGVHHPTAAGAAICGALTIGIAFLAYRMIEVPGRSFLRKFFERARPDVAAATPRAAENRA